MKSCQRTLIAFGIFLLNILHNPASVARDLSPSNKAKPAELKALFSQKVEFVGRVNVATLMEHAFVRNAVLDYEDHQANDRELNLMCNRINESMSQGVRGPSTGFCHVPGLFANTRKIGAQREDARPGSVKLIGPSSGNSTIAAQAAFCRSRAQPRLEATSWQFPAPILSKSNPDGNELAVGVGANTSGLPLNRELTDCSARFLWETTTVPQYKLFTLAGFSPARPGLVRVAEGSVIATVGWALPSQSVDKILQSIPAPLGLRSIFLEDDSTAHGFLCEALAVKDAEDITHFGGWRAYLASLSPSLKPNKEHYDATT